MRVLLIEDDSAMARSIELMLRSEGLNVYTTDLGEEGIDLGKLYDYDIIVLDLQLPDMSGFEVLKALRVSKVQTPVLILSGNAIVEAKVKALGFGALTADQRDALEEALIAADTGPRHAAALADEVAKGGPDTPAQALADALEFRLAKLQGTLTFEQKPTVILLVGVNGSGKTTTLGKLAAQWAGQGFRLSRALPAADLVRTLRAEMDA